MEFLTLEIKVESKFYENFFAEWGFQRKTDFSLKLLLRSPQMTKTVFGNKQYNKIMIWQRKSLLSEVLRIWKRRGMGIAVILGHLMHSNGGPFTTSFYLNGPKSRGRKQLNNKLQIFFHSTASFNQFYLSVVTNHVSSSYKNF